MMNYIESGMNFAPLFNDNTTIYIEKSSLFNDLGQGVKTVEFVSVRENTLRFIEAKSSAPNINNKESEKNILEYFPKI